MVRKHSFIVSEETVIARQQPLFSCGSSCLKRTFQPQHQGHKTIALPFDQTWIRMVGSESTDSRLVFFHSIAYGNEAAFRFQTSAA